MPEWIGQVIGLMHVYKITQTELAEHLGVRRDHINKILNGNKVPKNAEERITRAVKELIEKRSVA